jgi:phage shock protein PspC (stress-responsive transcriptional regulator)
MREVLTISLNGNAYSVERGGYEALRTYLENAQTRLSENPDRAEILADLEQAIGEKCDQYLGAGKNVVTAEEMNQVLTEMGPVVAEPAQPGAAGPAGAQGAPGAGAAPGGAAPDAPTTKRLYQIREGAIFSGVCMGLAAYFAVDVTIVRLLFVALAIMSGGLFVLAYIAMMVLIPYASTSEERAAAHGQPFNAAHLVDAFRRQASSAGAGQWREWRRQARRNARAWRREWRRETRHMRHMRWWGPPPHDPNGAPLLLSVLMPIATLLKLGLVFSFLFAVVQLITHGEILGWAPPPDIPLWVDILVMAVLLNVVTEPLRAMRRAYYYGSGANPWVALWGSVLWVGFMVVCVWLAYQYWPELQALIESLDSAFRERSSHTIAQAFSGCQLLQVPAALASAR